MRDFFSSVRDLYIQYPGSTADDIISSLSSSVKVLTESYWEIAFVCFGISVIVRLIESFRQEDKDLFIVGDLIIHAFVVVIGLTIWESYFLTVTNMFNLFADKIMPLDVLSKFLDNFWNQVSGASSFNILKIKINEFFGAVMGMLSMIASIGVFVSRKIMLSILYIFGGLMISVSPLPIFGLGHIGKLVTNHIQISSWVVIHSGFLLIMSEIAKNPDTGSIEFIIMSGIFLTVSVMIPTMAQLVFGGTSFMSVPIATNMAHAGAMKLGLSPTKKFGDMKASLLGKGAAGGINMAKSIYDGMTSPSTDGHEAYGASSSANPDGGINGASEQGASGQSPMTDGISNVQDNSSSDGYSGYGTSSKANK